MEALNDLILFRQEPEGLIARLCRGESAAAGDLIGTAVRYGWQGDLWRLLIAHSLAKSENAFSLACERRSAPQDSLWALALSDMAVYRRLLDAPPALPAADILTAFSHKSPAAEGPGAERICTLANALAAGTPRTMLDALTMYYEACGVGELGMGRVFRVGPDGRPFPVENSRPVALADLVGYESQKRLLAENTLAFLRGARANNVLLYGDAGTGKSTSIQALACELSMSGLRLIELYKHQFALIPAILSQIKERNYRFILFLDDLSFEENEVEYKHLKAVMEGGAEAAPENVLIYATSNRRHLIRETWNDRSDMEHDGDIHRSDTMEEKLSLAARFGLQIYYPNPTFEEYHAIVQALAGKAPALAAMPEAELRAAASTWQVRHASRSGRTARQFINDLLCRGADISSEREDIHADA